MHTVIIHNPCNEHTKNYRYYNFFWEQLTTELKKSYTVIENRYFEYAHQQRFEVTLAKGISENFFLLECECVIEFQESGDFYVLSASDTLTHAILNEQHNTHLKQVLISQFNREEITNHVHVDNLHKYSPWIYFPAVVHDLEFFFEKRKTIQEFTNKLLFRGTSLEDRSILKHFDKQYFSGPSPIGGPDTYFNELIHYTVGLSVAGRAQFCYRDVEYMALGVPFIRFEYTNELNPNLIPNYHYISVDRPTDLLMDRAGTEYHAQLLTERFLEVKDDTEFLIYIANNAREYYTKYLADRVNIEHTLQLLNLGLRL